MNLEGDFIKINKALLPLSWLFSLGVRLRNMMFDIGLLKSQSFDVPVISVGNITVGGTGKTPHVEYLIKILQDYCHVAVLSRGYKRKSKGFIKATATTTMTEIGDEPFQMKQKFPKVTIAVDKNRCHGIERLTSEDKEIDVILLDDAFQHRYVKPGINILLVDYHRLIIYDEMLPAGRLREPLSGKERADILIVTKCPQNLKPMEYRVITKAMNLYPYQRLFFTTIDYGMLQPVFDKQNSCKELKDLQDHHILLLTGIASPEQMVHDMSPLCKSIQPMVFADHYQYKAKDAQLINKTFDSMPEPKLIVTTEKDTTRLTADIGLSEKVKEHIYSLPINISFMLEQENNFNNQIIDYVHKNSRNSILAKRKDDNKPKDGNRAGDRPRTISFRNH
ncbi:MAG: tetraacyldisaccharide 4'-kinase [Prevotella sp.]|nr:tetraacyldisaccharide 4'-kinase [Prevotella sp.]